MSSSTFEASFIMTQPNGVAELFEDGPPVERSDDGSGCGARMGCYSPAWKRLEPGVDMLDAYIIDRIRRERESRESGRIPLRIEIPRPPSDGPSHRPDYHRQDPSRSEGEEEQDSGERGMVIIDFTI